MSTAATNGDAPRKLKILMLHGYTQSGPSFHSKTRSLEKKLTTAFPAAPKPGHLPEYPGGVELVYPTGPMKLAPSDIPGYDADSAKEGEEQPEAYGWWKFEKIGEPNLFRYEGLDLGFERVAEVIKESGPFDGCIGFSQGAGFAGILASMFDTGRKDAFEKVQEKGGMAYPKSLAQVTQPPLKFAVSYAGFLATADDLYQAFYEPKISTPMLHFLGSADSVVEEARSLKMVDACVMGRGVEGGVARVVYHPGGHVLPTTKPYMTALVGFIKESVDPPAESKAEKEEESVEDMNVPF